MCSHGDQMSRWNGINCIDVNCRPVYFIYDRTCPAGENAEATLPATMKAQHVKWIV